MTDIQRIRDNLQCALNMGGLREAAEWAISELDKIPEGFALVPVEPTMEVVEALKDRIGVTNRGGILNAGNALAAAIAAAPKGDSHE